MGCAVSTSTLRISDPVTVMPCRVTVLLDGASVVPLCAAVDGGVAVVCGAAACGCPVVCDVVDGDVCWSAVAVCAAPMVGNSQLPRTNAVWIARAIFCCLMFKVALPMSLGDGWSANSAFLGHALARLRWG